MWTNENRTRYDRSKLRYPSDLTDDEWKLIEPLIPPGKPGGGKRTVNLREVRERPHVHSIDEPPVARDPERPATKKYDLRLFRMLRRRRYQGPQFADAMAKILAHVDVEIVKRAHATVAFKIVPKRWIVERTTAWLNRCRRIAKDWEKLNRRALAF